MFIIFAEGSSTNCIKSLSKDEITLLKLFSLAILTNVAITSSASTPSISIKGKPIALQTFFSGTNCSRKSSGIGGLFALYESYISFLNVFPLASNVTMIGEPSLSFFKVISMFVTPLIAPVGLPSEVVRGGMA